MHLTLDSLPRLGVGISSEPGSVAQGGLDARVLSAAHPGLIHFLEYGTDFDRGLDDHVRGWANAGGATTYHFLDLNLEDPDDLDPAWIARTRQAAREIGAAWLCGDAGLWHIGRRDRGHQLLLPPILTDDSARTVGDSVRALSEATGLAVLPENPPGDVYVGPLHLLDYFARVADRSGGGLLLDCAHLAIFQRQRGLHPLTGLDGFPLDRVIEMHVAGGVEIDVDGLPLIDDAHGSEPLADTWQIFEAVLPRAKNLCAIVFECERNPAADVIETFARLNRAFPQIMSAHLTAQRVLVRMIYDPSYASAVAANPRRVLSALPPELADSIGATDLRALRRDRHRRERTLGQLSTELPASTTLAVHELGRMAPLLDFYASAEFHEAIDGDQALVLALAAYLMRALAEGQLRSAHTAAVLALELASARARRDVGTTHRAGMLRRAPGVEPVEAPAGALATLQIVEQYRFRLSLLPSWAVATDPPAMDPMPALGPAKITLAAIAIEGKVSLVEIERPLYAVLLATPAPRTQKQILDEAALRLGDRAAAEAALSSLLADELLLLTSCPPVGPKD